MCKPDIVVIGASSGGFGAIKRLVAGLPANFNASVFIVWHMAAELTGVLPDVLNKFNRMRASEAVDGELVRPRRIYVAAPDHHLVLEDGYMRLPRGPKVNRFRPAVDPLFTSAALSYGERVIGIILSGSLNDGTSGLRYIKHHGGIAVVQDPDDAEVRGMPESARNNVNVDYIVPLKDMPALLQRLTGHTGNEGTPYSTRVNKN